jgi:hypothetical protein
MLGGYLVWWKVRIVNFGSSYKKMNQNLVFFFGTNIKKIVENCFYYPHEPLT